MNTSAAPFTLRPMVESDREAVIDLLWDLNRFENIFVGNRALDRESALAHLEVNIQRCGELGGIQTIATDDTTPLGYLCAIVDMAPFFIDAPKRRHVFVADLVVKEHARGRGMGRALLQAAEAFTRSQGLTQMLIGAVHGNVRADSMYERFGFKAYTNDRLKTLD